MKAALNTQVTQKIDVEQESAARMPCVQRQLISATCVAVLTLLWSAAQTD